ncbi:MAG TPA: hypothetical protein VNJ71_05460 [Gemmatimonadales bacterium]|jgi:formylmethanofuran dehydrogenase subunit B|nr:hypothetical protein [Gemmatimonadales bacterium]
MAPPPLAAEARDVTCPFCGLLCDDLVVSPANGRLAVQANGCSISTAAFAHQAGTELEQPRVRGRAASLEQAVQEAAVLLRQARQPLFAGLGTDVAGARAAARLAERLGGVLDHMNAAAAIRNTLALQDRGWITTTLSEIRNRVDLLIVIGDVTRRFPRFLERCLVRERMFEAAEPVEVVFLGPAPPEGAGAVSGLVPRAIPCEVRRLPEALGVLRALVAGRRLEVGSVAGVPLATWRELAQRLRRARYGVVAWAAADLDFPHADLAVQALSELVKDLNRTTRFAGLPLGGSDGDVTVDAVHLWQTGFAARTSYARGYPEYDPWCFAAERLLASGEADVLVWISSFDERRGPPAAPVPAIVLGRPGMRFAEEPAVVIPVGTPGVDHAGHLFRTDRVVALPLRSLRDSALPGVAQVLDAIERAL